MRILSDYEKQIVGILSQYEYESLMNVIFDIVDDENIGIRIDYAISTINFSFFLGKDGAQLSSDDAMGLTRMVTELTRKIATTINLLKLLEKEGYVSFYTSASSAEAFDTTVQGVPPNNIVQFRLPDTEIETLFIAYSKKFIIISQAVKNYIQSGYKTPEQVRHSQIMIRTYIAIMISFAIGISGLMFNAFLPKKSYIDSIQFDSLISNIKAIRIDENKIAPPKHTDTASQTKHLKKSKIKRH